MAHQRSFQCSHCIRQFYNRAGLKNHMHRIHGSQAGTSASDRSSRALSPIFAQLGLSPPHYLDSEEEQPLDVNFGAFPDVHDEYDDGE